MKKTIFIISFLLGVNTQAQSEIKAIVYQYGLLEKNSFNFMKSFIDTIVDASVFVNEDHFKLKKVRIDDSKMHDSSEYNYFRSARMLNVNGINSSIWGLKEYIDFKSPTFFKSTNEIRFDSSLVSVTER